MQATRIIAIRHGETAWNAAARLQGHQDIVLNALGLWQAEQAAQSLVDEPVVQIYSSDLQRAYQTAQAIATTTGAPLATDPGLRERNFGIYEGQTFAELEAAHPEVARRWRQRDPAFTPEGGESLTMLRDRVAATVEHLAARHAGELIVLTAHGGVLDTLYRLATGQDLQAPRTWELGNAAINRLLWTPQGLGLIGWADEQHLEAVARDELAG